MDILVTGHTHKQEVLEIDGRHIINPGSISGAFSPHTKDVVPSFMLMGVKGDVVNTFIYTLIDGKIDIHNFEIKK